MKRILFISAVLLTALSLSVYSSGMSEDDYKTYRGKIVDAQNGQPLIFATIRVHQTNIATVSNLDGEFLIKVPFNVPSEALEIAYLGYTNRIVPLSEMHDNGVRNEISLQVARIPVGEVVVRPVSANEIMENVVKNLPRNYTSEPNLMTAFYRETIRKRRNYVAIGEAVVQIFKAPYYGGIRNDEIRIFKGRKGSDVSRMDTIMFKLQGGPVTSLQLDIVKNPEAIITSEALGYYNYVFENFIMIDDRLHYVVDFEQKPEIITPLFFGKFYIDTETYAIKEAEFGMNLTNINEAKDLFVRKKPLTMDVEPELAVYRVVYREDGGKWYFAYSRAEVRFKVKWRRRIFNSNYTTMSEIAVTDRTTENVLRFAGRERIRFTDVFSEKVSDFEDPDFWGDYNIIEPDQSIENAIERLSRRLNVNDIGNNRE